MPKVANWDWEIKPESSWRGLGIKELFGYRDLLISLTRKEFLASYQQTLLGPFWVFFQPIFTVLTYVLVFNKVIGIKTGDVPPLLFNLTGILLWNFFSEVFFSISRTFTENAHIFEKVYFPRIIVAFSSLWLQFILFGFQFLLLLGFYLYYLISGNVVFNLGHIFLIFPVLIITGGIGFGAGLVFSVLTAKYRDLLSLLQLLIRLLMFLCPIFYSLEMVPKKVRWLVQINPLSAQFEAFRYAFISKGSFTELQFLYGGVFMVILVYVSVLIFNKWGDELMDYI
ncbi:MAG TPA: ABC transporter permease [Mucilaginibacter sp.]